MSAERWETLIIGGGVAGLATAWHLARRGCERVLLVERDAQLGAESSGKNAAILRTFGADPILNEVSARIQGRHLVFRHLAVPLIARHAHREAGNQNCPVAQISSRLNVGLG